MIFGLEAIPATPFPFSEDGVCFMMAIMSVPFSEDLLSVFPLWSDNKINNRAFIVLSK